MTTPRHRALKIAGSIVAPSMLLSACASLPTSGPTAGQVIRAVQAPTNQIGMRVVDINPAVVSSVASSAAAADGRIATIASLAREGRNDIVGPGDVLAINLYEVGTGLFSGPRGSGISVEYDPSAKSEVFPAIVVGNDGSIELPYAGRMEVAGKTPSEIRALIERAYHGKSQAPQVLVGVKQNLSETVYVTGDVRRPGRIELTLQRERLLDAVAQAGGAVTQTQDMVVRFVRGGQSVEERLDRIHAGAPDDLVLVTGDRIELMREPQTFTVFGAAGKVAQMPFDQTDLTLAEAIARSGGPNDVTANPRSIFLFRYDPAPDSAAATVPTIYRFNMMDPTSYFLAQRFRVRNKDVLYVSNAKSNKLAKFVAIINQFFSPVVAARVVTQ